MPMTNNTHEELTLMVLLRLFRHRARFLTYFVFACLLLLLAYTFIMPQIYRSTATLLPPKQNQSSGRLSSFLENLSGGGGLVLGGMGQNNQSQMFSGVLKSRSVAEYVIDTLALTNHPFFKGMTKDEIYESLKNAVEIDIEKSGIISVTVFTQTPYFSFGRDNKTAAALAASVANKSIDGLDDIIRTKNVSTARKTRKYIEVSLIEYKKKLDSIEITLEKFKSENKILEIDAQTEAILNQATQVGSEMTKAEIDLNIARQEFDEASPRVKSYQKSLQLLKDQYEKIQKGGLISSDAFSIPLAKVPALERIYTDLVRDQKVLVQVILYLETQRHEEAIQEEKDLPVVEVLDKAVVPAKRYSPNRVLTLILGFFVSLLLGMSFVTVNAIVKGNVYLKKMDAEEA